ncbi:MAG: hypothetical protein IPK13_25855 [Deltaproteobacteria bacterium]|nr:hypothetical protein [Deltaproteobacteria bacterium]
MSERVDTRRLLRTLGSASRILASTEDLISATWHLGALPAAQDIRRASRRALRLRRRVSEAERQLAELERTLRVQVVAKKRAPSR